MSAETLQALGVVFVSLLITLMVMGIFLVIKDTVKEKVNWWHRKWRMEDAIENLERRVDELERKADE